LEREFVLLLLAFACSKSGVPPQAGKIAPDFRADDLTADEHKFLRMLATGERFKSIRTLAPLVGPDEIDLQRNIEPELIYRGLVAIDSRGRLMVK